MSPKPPPPPVHLNGTTLEGGGQLFRLALNLSSLTKSPLTITNIRGNRSGAPGLKAQHLTSASWLGTACNARISGAHLKSRELTFTPHPTETLDLGREIRITQNTPGAITLVLQAILPFLVFSASSSSATPIRIRISGGTNVSNSPSFDYIHAVLFPMLALIGLPRMTAHLDARGWSQGAAGIGSVSVTLTVLDGKLPTFDLTERGEVVGVEVVVVAPRDTERAFRDEVERMMEVRGARFFNSTTTPEYDVSFEPSYHEKRYYVLLVATTSTGIKLGRDWLYDRTVRPGHMERIVPSMLKKVSDDLIGEIEHGGCVDEWMRDQLVVFQALAEGRSRVDGGGREPSLHARTAMWVASEILGVKWVEGECEGIGFVPGGKGEVNEEIVDGVRRLEIGTNE
jgi:RNA 3'-terminal phosphate cyclase (ATP)